MLAIARCLGLVARLKAKFRRGDHSFDINDFDPLLYAAELKAEAKRKNADKTKNRIFFNGPTWYFLLEKYLIAPVFEMVKKRGMNGLGVSWGQGDAQRMANDAEDFEDHEDGDIRKLDMHELAQEMGVVMATWIMYYEDDNSEEYFLVRQFFLFMITSGFAKLICWPDGFYRVVSGMNFSGDFKTALLNTEYCGNVNVCFQIRSALEAQDVSVQEKILRNLWNLVRVGQQRTEEAGKTMLKLVEYISKFAGDDFLADHKNGMKEHLGIIRFGKYAKEKFSLEVKVSDSNECKTFTTKDRSDGTIRLEKHNVFGKDVLKPSGPVFLKHYFVERSWGDTKLVVPYRPTAESWYRGGKTVTDTNNKLVMLYRLHGLMLNSLGTNYITYLFFNSLADKLVTLDPDMEPNAYTDFRAYQQLRDVVEKYKYAGLEGFKYQDYRSRPSFLQMEKKIMSQSLYAKQQHQSLFVPSIPRVWSGR